MTTGDHYDRISKVSGVSRELVKRVMLAHSYSGGSVLPSEEAIFKAGYDAAAQRAVDFHPTKITDWQAHRQAAWEEFK